MPHSAANDPPEHIKGLTILLIVHLDGVDVEGALGVAFGELLEGGVAVAGVVQVEQPGGGLAGGGDVLGDGVD